MAGTFQDAERFLAALVKQAEALRLAILAIADNAERSRHVMDLVAECDMVFGVWPDPDAPDGVGLAIVKGEDMMPPLVGFETEREVKVAAIPCACREIAAAARDAWGAAETAGEPAMTVSRSTALSISELARQGWVVARRAQD